MKKMINRIFNVWPFKLLKWRYLRHKDKKHQEAMRIVTKRNKTFNRITIIQRDLSSPVQNKQTSPEEKLEMGRKSLDELRDMFKAWLKSDFRWATETPVTEKVTGKDDEWDFLFSEWKDKFESWMFPYVARLRDMGYITNDDAEAFTEEIYDNMRVMLEAIRALTGGVNNEQDV